MIRRNLAPGSERGGERVQELQENWVNILFLSLTPVIGVLGTAAYAIAFGVRWWEPTLFFVLFGLVSFSVTAGYHRCFAHKAYVSHPALQAFYLFFGAIALQNSALKWSPDHRDHHRHVDRDWDPYNIKRGGWLIAFLRFAGLARDLRKTPKAVIEKSRLRIKLAKAERQLLRTPEGAAEGIRLSGLTPVGSSPIGGTDGNRS